MSESVPPERPADDASREAACAGAQVRAEEPAAMAVGSARALAAMAPVVRLGFLVIGVAIGLQTLASAVAERDVPPGRLAASAAQALAGAVLYAMIGWVAGRLLPVLAEVVARQEEQASAARAAIELIRTELIPTLDRLAERLAERGPVATQASGAVPDELNEIRRTIRAGDWTAADAFLRAFAERAPDHPELARLTREHSEAKENAVQVLMPRLEAAREANDPERVLELRDGLVPLLEHEPLHTLDRELAKWFMSVIHKRLRAGTVRPDVAILAGRVAASLDATAEGASLRAALPTLRRSAGLCARCAEPYTGIADACPKCLAAVPLPAFRSEPDEA